MLVKKIMEEDTKNCFEAMEADEQLKKAEEIFYELLEIYPNDANFEMERIINEYIARVIRIAYLQGIRDFAEMFITLKKDVREILQSYIDK